MSTRPQDSFDLYRTSTTSPASTDAVRLARQLRCELALERCSRILLKSHHDGYPEQQETLSQALHALLQGVDVTRLYLFRNYEHPERGFCSQMLAEAIAPNATSNLGDARGQALPWSRWPQSICDELAAGNPVGGLIAEIFASTPTMLHALNGLGIVAAYYFSIFVNERWWGFIGYDLNYEPSRWSEDEIRLLRIAAEMIGAALEQWQSDQSLAATHQQLARQLNYEAALKQVSQHLLQVAHTDAERIDLLNKAMSYLLAPAQVGRVYLFQNFDDPELGPSLGMYAEACAPNFLPDINTPGVQRIAWSASPAYHRHELAAGRPIHGPTAELYADMPDVVELLHSRQIISVYFSPIFVNQQWWGYIGFDDCVMPRKWSDEEGNLLSVAADMIGATLERWRIEGSLQLALREQAHQLRYEIALERCSTLLLTLGKDEANVQAILAVALHHLLEATQTSRISIYRNVIDAELGLCSSFYVEALEEGMLSQRSVRALQCLPWKNSPPNLYHSLANGRAIGGLSEELYENSPAYLEILHSFSTLSTYYFPITVQGEWWGIIGYDESKYKRSWSDAEVRLLGIAAEMIGTSLGRWEIEESLRIANRVQERQLRYEIALEKFSSALLTPSQNESALQATFTLAIQHLLKATQATHVYISHNFNDPEAGPCTSIFAEASVLGQVSTTIFPVLQKLPMRLSSPRVLSSLASGRSVGGTIEQVYGDSPTYLAIARQLNVQAMYIFPIFVGDHWWGTIGYAEASADRTWEADELRMLTVASDMLGATLERWQTQEQLRTTNERLEQQVSARTSELRATVASLNEENAERRRTEAHLATSRQQLRQLAARQEAVREGERTRISREIHDDLGQSLTALKMDVAWLNRHLPDAASPIQQKLAAMSNLISDTIKTVQRVARDLRPGLLDNLGLSAAIEWQLQEFEQRTGIHCQLQQNELGTLHTDLITTLFRIFQETLTNVARHAQASKVDVRLQREHNQITLTVSDNGVGIDVAALKQVQSLGLLGMTERIQAWNGDIHFEGAPAKGTTVTITVPIPPPPIYE